MCTIRHIHIRHYSLTLLQQFLLLLGEVIQWGVLQNRIEHHIHVSVCHSYQGESGSALDTVTLVYLHANRQYWRWSTIADVIQGIYRKVFNHLMGESKLSECLIWHFTFFK